MAEPSISQLRNFLLVVEHGSFHAAAGEAFRSQPAISKSIQALEEHLGQQLFEPGRRSSLTPFGASCLPMAREAISHYDRSLQSMLSLADSATGAVALAAIGGVASSWLPSITERFIGAHPRVAVTLIDDNTQNIAKMVGAGDVDLGLCAEIDDPHLAFEPLIRDRFGLVCRADHPLAARSEIRWKDLADLRLISTTAHRQLGESPEQQLLANRPLEVRNMLTLLSMLEHGVAQTVLPSLAIPDMISGLAFVPLSAPRRFRQVGTLTVKGRTLSPAAASFATLVSEHAHAIASERRPGS